MRDLGDGGRGNEGGREGKNRGLEDERAGGPEGNKRGLEVARAGGPEGVRETIRVRGRVRERRGREARTRGHEAGRQPATGSGTITLRVLKPDPMPAADQRDAGPYLRVECARSEAARAARGAAPTLARRVVASGWGLAVRRGRSGIRTGRGWCRSKGSSGGRGGRRAGGWDRGCRGGLG
jgi:hypothetical protein